MKHSVIALKVYEGAVEVDDGKAQMELPSGCTGILFCFESKKAARAYWGMDVEFIRGKIKQDE